MAYPKIVYGAGPTTLTFTYPPVQKQGAEERNIVRNDTISGSGKKQSVFLRSEHFLTLQMDFVPAADVAAWSSFMDWAEQGNAFDYYPDASSGTHTSYTLEDTTWNPAFAFRGYSKFKMKMRKAV